ncbi:MAG: Rab family GTPase [Promethearchaeota archaeon]|jgi:Ras-related protein Rab-23
MNETSKKFSFKIAIVGDGMVGKTSLIKKFTKGSFRHEYIKTIGAQFSVFDKEINNDKIRLLFWDIAGQVGSDFLRPSFFNNSRACIIVYSLEENELGERSFSHIQSWHEEILQHCNDIPMVIFANKVDLIDDSNRDESKIQNLVENQHFLGFYKTSAKTGEGVIEAFNAIIEHLYYKSKKLSLES